MNSEWREVCLGDIFKVKHGFAFKGEFFTDEIQPYALVTPGNFAIGGGFQTQKQKYYRGPVPGEYVLQPGMVVVTMTDLSKQSDTLGYAALVPDDGTIWLHNQRVGLLIFRDPDESDPIFFSYLLRTQTYRAWVVGSATGTTVKHTAPSRIESFRCFVPNIDEQQRIAYALKCLDDKIDLNRRINQTLEAMAQAIFKSWFVDFDPVKAKIAAIEQGQDPLRAAMRAISGKTDTELDQMPREQHDQLAATAALFPDAMEDAAPGSANAASAGRAAAASELGEIPKGWEAVPASTLIEFNPKEPLRKGTVAPYLDMASLPTSDSWAERPTLREFGSGMRFRNGDALLARITPCLENGKSAFVQNLPAETVGWGSTEFIVMRSKKPVPQEYAYLLVRHSAFREHAIRSMTGTSGRQRAQADAVAEFKVVTPSNALVWSAFGEFLASFFRKIKSLSEEMETLAQLRDTLLPKLLSGELSINPMQEANDD